MFSRLESLFICTFSSTSRSERRPPGEPARPRRPPGGPALPLLPRAGGPAQVPAGLPDALPQVHPQLPPLLRAPVQGGGLRVHQAEGVVRGAAARRANPWRGVQVGVHFCSKNIRDNFLNIFYPLQGRHYPRPPRPDEEIHVGPAAGAKVPAGQAGVSAGPAGCLRKGHGQAVQDHGLRSKIA